LNEFQERLLQFNKQKTDKFSKMESLFLKDIYTLTSSIISSSELSSSLDSESSSNV
jgi:hypothetical protein